ncbi:MAG TPA: hypothetical protein DCS88_12230 [Alphaproteobacteria bacterium]|nr:hypothetical protein [Alphaproteobacteria bacterium]
MSRFSSKRKCNTAKIGGCPCHNRSDPPLKLLKEKRGLGDCPQGFDSTIKKRFKSKKLKLLI